METKNNLRLYATMKYVMVKSIKNQYFSGAKELIIVKEGLIKPYI